MRYVLYARKSSESEDRQVQSIDDQLRILRELARARGLSVIEEITESHSAKAPGDRPGFERVIKMVERGEADALLCWAVNRLTRNPIDAGRLSWLLQKETLKCIQTVEKQFLPSDNVLLFAIETGVANQDILTLRKNVLRGLESKVLKGWAPQRALDGYKNDPVLHTIVADEEEGRFALIQRAWRLVIAGTHTPAEAVRVLNEEWGYRTRVTYSRRDGTRRGGTVLSRSAGYRIFSSVFYAGYFRYAGQVHKGSHPAMITLAEFEVVQRRLRGGSIGDGQVGKAHRRCHWFPYAGMLRCGRCGRGITAERQSGRHKRGDWIYYRCPHGCGGCSAVTDATTDATDGRDGAGGKRSIREDELEREIDACLARVTITEQVRPVVTEALERWLTDEFGGLDAVYTAQMRDLAIAERMLGELLELRLRSVIDDATYTAKQRELSGEVGRLRLAVGRTQERLDRVRQSVTNALDFREHAREQFLLGEAAKRREIAQALGASYVLTDGAVTIELSPLLAIELPSPPTPPTPLPSGSTGSADPARAVLGGTNEPRESSSQSAKETLSGEKVSTGWTAGTELIPLYQVIRQCYEDDIINFWPSTTGAW